MTTTLRDALQAVRINRMKARAAKAWQQRRKALAEAEPGECNCFACLIRRGLVAGVRLRTDADDEPQAPAAPVAHSH